MTLSPWLSARLQYLQCISNGDTAVLRRAIDLVHKGDTESMINFKVNMSNFSVNIVPAVKASLIAKGSDTNVCIHVYVYMYVRIWFILRILNMHSYLWWLWDNKTEYVHVCVHQNTTLVYESPHSSPLHSIIILHVYEQYLHISTKWCMYASQNGFSSFNTKRL